MAKGQCPEDRRYFPTQKLAYWYFRLNGFLTMENFILHPKRRGPARTDADLYGVRFPYRNELGMRDDTPFEDKKKPLFVLVEIKKGTCELNGPWTDRNRKNVEYVLEAIGAFKPALQKQIADALHEQSFYDDETLEVRLITVGNNPNEQYQKTRPHLLQLRLADMLRFIYMRFDCYEKEKKDHSQWDQCGHNLWEEFEAHKNANAFADCIMAKLV